MKDTNSLSHTSYRCKYHIVIVPKYRRLVIYNKLRADIIEIIKILVNRKPDLKIIEGEACPDYIQLLMEIPPKYSVSEIMGYLKSKSTLMIFDRHANLKYKFGNRHFWAKGYFVDTVGKNEKISRVLYAYSDMYHLNMVYAKTDKNEYLIPYFEESRQIDSSDKQTRIENGRIYTAENFMKRMNAIYDEEALRSNPDANTGVPKRETAGVLDHSSKLLITVTMLCTVSLGSIFVFVRRRRKFAESHSPVS